ncbi:glycosyltransferase family 2 protein [Aquirufa novilacunae]|jgi:glycosyltransferase involved in cell wall biosynthesis|uniref:Glycosyltransferase family 2 protein n=1 Tax=Aquirufa novilacunae TaxID=3139305 RepID=A0ABW8U331_9BACT
MSKNVKISVLMAVYNTEFSLTKRAIDSVLQQDFQDFELIIIDDGSKGNDRKELLAYVEKYEDKIVYIRHSNRGQAESINRGVLISTGEFITILDSDDEYKVHHLSSCLQEMEHVDLICSTAETVVDSVEDYYVPDKNDLSKPIHLDDAILFGTLFGHQKVFKSIDFKGGFAADSAFFERAETLFKTKKVFKRSYIYYRNNPNSTCAVLKKQLALNEN